MPIQVPLQSPSKAKRIKAHSTVSSSSLNLSFDDVIEHDVYSFIGPPSTGIDSRSLAPCFQRIALRVVRDEAEIPGHHQAYVVSGPCLLVQVLHKASRMDSVLLL